LETVVLGGSLGLFGFTSLGSLLLEGSSSGGNSFLFSLGEDLFLLGSEWVESVHGGSVGEWVDLLGVGNIGGLGVSELSLNLIGVDNSSKISAGHEWSVDGVTGLFDGVSEVGTVESVESSESILGEDGKSTDVTTWGELKDVKSINVARVNTWEVSGSLSELGVVITVDNEWTLSEGESGVSVFTLTVSQSLGRSNSVKIIGDTEVLKGGEEGLGVWNVEGVNDEWEFWNILDLVTSGLNKRSNGGGGESGGNSMSSLSDVASSVPVSPDLKWSEHSSLSAHVTEGSLARSRSTGT